ncbi:unnamed protein product [Orchesella dallaii]|uniref:NADH dehydrogenase [ubiquinone] 1 beta subcomplex subunit 3 n=1 Tax=Orchesella dallaii TaxID=48710 RepID=A0ABP1QFH0_9HEXA
MGGGGHHHTPKVPDYKIYKVEDIPELMGVKRALAAKGLKDPWLRNEVWKYDPKIKGTMRQTLRSTFGRGMAVGLGLAVVTTIIEKVMEDKDHGHGHAEGH